MRIILLSTVGHQRNRNASVSMSRLVERHGPPGDTISQKVTTMTALLAVIGHKALGLVYEITARVSHACSNLLFISGGHTPTIHGGRK